MKKRKTFSSNKVILQKHFDNLATSRNYWINKSFGFYSEDRRAMKELIPENSKILEIGCGNGQLIASLKPIHGVGIDISKNCLKIANMNANNLKVNNRLKLYKSNVDKFTLGKYDLIVSNPPYIKKHILRYLDKGVAKFEPKIALDGGLDGLSEIRKVIKKSSELIKKNGKFILEIGFDQKNKVIKLLNKEGFYINSALKDLADNDRCIICTKI